MFHFRPAPERNMADIATIKRAIPFLHWGHVFSGILASVSFLVFAIISTNSKPILRLSSGTAAVLIALMLWSGLGLTAGRLSEDQLSRSYILHIWGLPLLPSLGLTILAALRFRRWFKATRATLGEGNV